DLTDPLALSALSREMAAAAIRSWTAAPIIGGSELAGPAQEVFDPADRRRVIGSVATAGEAQIAEALRRAERAAAGWDATPAGVRAASLERAADLMEA